MKNIFTIITSVIFGNKFFDINERAKLLEFWVIMLIFFIFPIAMFNIFESGTVHDIFSLYMILIMPWIVWSVIVRRFHDINMSGWWMLLILPLVALPIVKGNTQKNRFDTKE